MNHFRAVFAAVAATAALTFAATAAQACSPLSSSLAFPPTTAEAVPPTVSVQEEEKTTVPEPVSMALLGIGISSLITFRRFRKLFN